MKTEQHIFKIDIGIFYTMKESLIYHIDRELETLKIKYDHYTIKNFYKQGTYAIIIIDIHYGENDRVSVPRELNLTAIMQEAQHNDTCYIDFPSYYNFFQKDEEFLTFEFSDKRVHFVATCMSKPYYHLVRKRK